MASVFRDFSLTIGSRLLAGGASVATQSCLAWALGPNDLGALAICMVFGSMLMLVFTVGCDTVNTYFVAAGKHTLAEGVAYTIVYGLVGSFIAVAAGVAVLEMHWSFMDKAPLKCFYLALSIIPLSLLASAFMRLFTAVHEFRLAGILYVIHSLSGLVLAISLVCVLDGGVVGALVVVIAQNALTIVFCLSVVIQKNALSFVRISMATLRQMFGYAFRYHVGKVSQMVNFQIGTIILSFFADTKSVGLFAVAAQLISQIFIIPDNLTTVLMPRVAKHGRKQAETVAMSARLSGITGGVFLLGLGVLAPPIVAVMYSDAFLPIVPLIRLMAFGGFVWCGCKVFVSYLLGAERPGLVSSSVVAGITANLALLVVLLPRIGLTGAAAAMTGGYLVNSLLLMRSFRRLTGLSYSQILFFGVREKDILRSLLLCMRGRRQMGMQVWWGRNSPP